VVRRITVSLLKRIEQGQTQELEGGKEGGGGSSRLTTLSARRVAPPGSKQRDTYYDLKNRVQNKLLSELDPSMDVSQTAEVRRTIEELFESILTEERIVLSRPERRRLFEQIVHEILGLGPLEPLLADETITEVMVNGSKNIYVEREGKIFREGASFESDDHLMRIIDRIVAPLGRRIDESSPYVDARLADGSRVNAVIPPISLVGPVLTIRKFARTPITIQQLIEYGTITAEAVEFLKSAVLARINAMRMQQSCRCARSMSYHSRSGRQTLRGAARLLSSIWWSTPCACAPIASSWVRFVTQLPWTCCRP
jgi:pilus assembly protein CpaF